MGLQGTAVGIKASGRKEFLVRCFSCLVGCLDEGTDARFAIFERGLR